jgi:hypothetical protein
MASYSPLWENIIISIGASSKLFAANRFGKTQEKEMFDRIVADMDPT